MVVVIKHFVCTMCTNIVVIQRSLKNHLRWFRLFTAAYAFLWQRPLRSQLVAPRKSVADPSSADRCVFWRWFHNVSTDFGYIMPHINKRSTLPLNPLEPTLDNPCRRPAICLHPRVAPLLGTCGTQRKSSQHSSTSGDTPPRHQPKHPKDQGQKAVKQLK
jgi:hypothetical protein